MRCTSCATALAETTPACPACGAAPPPPAPPPPPPVVKVPVRLGRALVLLLALSALVDLVTAGVGLQYAGALTELVTSRTDADLDAALSVEDRYRALAITQLVVLVVAGVTWLVWQVRADRAARLLDGNGMRYATGWAAGAWFVPFLNLVRPKRMVDDLLRAVSPLRPPGYDLQVVPAPGITSGWWTLWLLGWLLSRVGGSIADGPFLEDLASGARVGAAADLAYVVAAVLAAVVVRRVTSGLATRRAGLLAAVPA